MHLTQEKISKKIFCPGPPWGRGRSLKGARMTFFECSQTPSSHSFRDIGMKFSRHITLEGIHLLFQKCWGSDPPGGKFVPKFFIEISICKFEGVMALTQEKIYKKSFGPGPPGLGGVASKVLELRFFEF